MNPSETKLVNWALDIKDNEFLLLQLDVNKIAAWLKNASEYPNLANQTKLKKDIKTTCEEIIKKAHELYIKMDK